MSGGQKSDSGFAPKFRETFQLVSVNFANSDNICSRLRDFNLGLLTLAEQQFVGQESKGSVRIYSVYNSGTLLILCTARQYP